nr:ATP-binding protein [Angustibacter aerolatus]
MLVGHCLDLAEQALPYLPLTEVLTRLAHEEPAAADRLLEAHPALALLVRGRRATGDDGAVDRADLFAAVHAGLALLADDGPVLLVVEDAHWADPSTREPGDLPAHPRHGGHARAVVPHRRPAPPAPAAAARRPVGPAARRGAAAAAPARRRRGAHPGRRPRAARRAGRPGHRQPRRGQRVLRRGAWWPRATQGVAWCRPTSPTCCSRGSSTSRTTPARSCGPPRWPGAGCRTGCSRRPPRLDDGPLDAAARAAVDANVLVPHGADGYAFRHALLAEAVYDDLLPGERVRLHAAYASALASGRFEGVAAEPGPARARRPRPRDRSASQRAGGRRGAAGGGLRRGAAAVRGGAGGACAPTSWSTASTRPTSCCTRWTPRWPRAARCARCRWCSTT